MYNIEEDIQADIPAFENQGGQNLISLYAANLLNSNNQTAQETRYTENFFQDKIDLQTAMILQDPNSQKYKNLQNLVNADESNIIQKIEKKAIFEQQNEQENISNDSNSVNSDDSNIVQEIASLSIVEEQQQQQGIEDQVSSVNEFKLFKIINNRIKKYKNYCIKQGRCNKSNLANSKSYIMKIKNSSNQSKEYKNCHRYIIQNAIKWINGLQSESNYTLKSLQNYLITQKSEFKNIEMIRKHWIQMKNRSQEIKEIKEINERNSLFRELCFEYLYEKATNDILLGNFVNKHIHLNYLEEMKKFIRSPLTYYKNRNSA